MSKRMKHTELRRSLRRCGITYENAAEALGLSLQGFVAKLDGCIPWKLAEAYKLAKLLTEQGYAWDGWDSWLTLWPTDEQHYKSIQRRN